jgi:putative SOS response-associated peptidase YedK
MPVILPPDKIDIWLEQGDANITELLSYLKPYPAEEMELSL